MLNFTQKQPNYHHKLQYLKSTFYITYLKNTVDSMKEAHCYFASSMGQWYPFYVSFPVKKVFFKFSLAVVMRNSNIYFGFIISNNAFNYASPTSGEAYRDRRLTTNFELWVEIFCVPTCFHMRIPKPCLSVCLSVRLSVHLSVPREKKPP